MSLSTDHKALLFLGAIAVLGAGVRVMRWSSGAEPADQTALEHQLNAADSAAHADRRQATRQKGSRSRSARANRSHKEAPASPMNRQAAPRGPGLNAPGYLLGKLDLDAATLAQIDSLPGIGPALAKRIVVDRTEHGPFVTLQGLRRVKGVGPSLLRRLDTLVTFSATLRPLSATPESVSARPARRVRR